MPKQSHLTHRRPWGLRAGLAIGLLLAAMVSGASGADIVRTFTSLSGDQQVYGVDATGQPAPFVNTDHYVVTAAGDDSGTLYNVNFGASGIYSAGPAVINYGAIDLSATGGISSTSAAANANTIVYAYGIHSLADVFNSGAIAVTATGGTATNTTAGTGAHAGAVAYGIRTMAAVTNSGAITVSATGGTANGVVVSFANGTAFGIHSNGGDVTNSGALTVSARGGTANGVAGNASAYGIRLINGSQAAVLSNSGAITVRASSASANAYGIYITDSLSPVITDLTNSGIIRAVAASEAYEVYVPSATVRLVATYNLNLDDDPATGSIYVSNGAALELNDAALTLTSVGDDFQWDTEYRLFAGAGTISGAFGSVSALNPNVAVTYNDGALANPSDDTVSLAYRPIGSTFLQGAEALRHSLALTGNLVNQRLVSAYLRPRLAATGTPALKLYATAGNTASDAIYDNSGPGNGCFLIPYYTRIAKDASPIGYDSDAVGFVTGYERRTTHHLAGFHLGYGRNEVDFSGTGFDDNDEDQDLLSAGIHAMGKLADWTWRTQVTGFYARHDYAGRTGAGLDVGESADYDSYGVAANLMGGYPMRLGNHLLLPEAGLDYLWLYRENFTTDADNPGWNLHSSSLDEHQLSATASLRWLARFPVADCVLTPSLAAGLRCLLTNDEIDAHQAMPGTAPVTVSAEQDDLSATLSASLLIAKGNFSTELAYAGEYGDDTTAHSAWWRLNFQF
ncbi:MAG: autotransporter outer membrane beta-barrel domain-containing protein [Deltaproteobacteria bacterium]|nr:autotransporter outer membrane beta-barrel domain-containing protein [Deltaproteobacteria bacterium]